MINKNTTEREKKAEQRREWRAQGWTEITVRVAKERAQEARDLVAALPDPTPPTNPDQQDLPL